MVTILHVQPVAERGGSDQLLLSLVRSLPPGEFRSHVVVPAPHPLAPELEEAGARVHVLPMRRLTTSGGWGYRLAYALAWPVVVARLVLLVRRTGADVVHSNSLHSLYGWAAAWLTRRPHLWHAREVVVQSPAALRLERALARRFATRVIAMSRAIAGQLHPGNVVVVYDGVDGGRFSPARRGRFRAAVGIAPGAPLVGFAGRVDTWKGLDVLLDAWPLVTEAVPSAQLVVAGPPVTGKEHYAAMLEARAGTQAGVHWLGPRSDLPELYADLDVFVAPSTEPEPFGMVIVEALASGVPVVSTAHGGPVEIAELAPGSVTLVPPGDADALAGAVVDLVGAAGPRDDRRSRWSHPAPDYAGIFRSVVEARTAEPG